VCNIVLPATHIRTIPAFTLQPQSVIAVWLGVYLMSSAFYYRRTTDGQIYSWPVRTEHYMM